MIRIRQIVLICIAITFLTVRGGFAQSSSLKHEFRGAWIATVINLDWPSHSGLSTASQKTELRTMMDGLVEAGINAVLFQVRSESDAMYSSSFEPWSVYLTGIQGLAPDPLYDPLEYAIQLAHERGMELHAWFNPFRVERSIGNYGLDASHVAVEHPEWILTINNHSVLNPGIPEARTYIEDVILDVVSRYDIDGVHFDDYFYPYPPNTIGNQDLDTFDTYGGGFATISEWRRHNINEFVREVSDGIAGLNPDAKFGISPFGIWRSGVPPGIVGLSAVDVLYGDAIEWMSQGWVDYVAPQLYWPFGGGQDFATLAPWWTSVSSGRHIYPGLATYRSDPATFSGSLYAATEIPNQIRFSRQSNGVEGNVLFRANNITKLHSQGLSDSLKTDLYKNLALTPYMNWRNLAPPGAPRDLGFIIPTKRGMGVVWSPPMTDPFSPPARKYALYRVRKVFEPDPRDVTNEPANLLAVTYDTFYDDAPPVHPDPYWYVVTALSANSVESDESNMMMFKSTGLDVETFVEQRFRFESVSPNPFRSQARIRFSLERPETTSIVVYDVLGREVSSLYNGSMERGQHEMIWDGNDRTGRALPSGIYFIRLAVGAHSTTKPVSLVR